MWTLLVTAWLITPSTLGAIPLPVTAVAGFSSQTTCQAALQLARNQAGFNTYVGGVCVQVN